MPTPSPKVTQATREQHKQIMAVAKLSKWTKDFGNMIFSGPEHYQKGWIKVVVSAGRVVAFSCFRVKVRSPEVKLYFIGVDRGAQLRGLGRLLMADLERLAAGRTIALDCSNENPAGEFYRRLGYTPAGPSLNGTATRWEKQIPAG